MKKVTVRKRCPECNRGEMKATGRVFTTNPPLYGHKCDQCSFQESYSIGTSPRSYYEYEEDETREEWE